MPLACLAVCLLLLGALSAAAADPSQTIAAARDRQRLLLVFAPDATALQAQLDRWKPAERQFKERDLIVLSLPAVDPASAPMARRYGIKATEFRVILIGKDGHDAARFREPVDPAEINRIIDAMPMRQAEMKKTVTP